MNIRFVTTVIDGVVAHNLEYGVSNTDWSGYAEPVGQVRQLPHQFLIVGIQNCLDIKFAAPVS